MGMPASSSSGTGVDVGGPGGGVAAVVGEVDDRVAQLLVAGVAERDRVIIVAITKGSLRNKFMFALPARLLSTFASSSTLRC